MGDKASAILEFVERYHAEHGTSPTVRQIRDGAGISSTSVVDYHGRKLVRAGELRKVRGHYAPMLAQLDRHLADLRDVLPLVQLRYSETRGAWVVVGAGGRRFTGETPSAAIEAAWRGVCRER